MCRRHVRARYAGRVRARGKGKGKERKRKGWKGNAETCASLNLIMPRHCETVRFIQGDIMQSITVRSGLLAAVSVFAFALAFAPAATAQQRGGAERRQSRARRQGRVGPNDHLRQGRHRHRARLGLDLAPQRTTPTRCRARPSPRPRRSGNCSPAASIRPARGRTRPSTSPTISSPTAARPGAPSGPLRRRLAAPAAGANWELLAQKARMATTACKVRKATRAFKARPARTPASGPAPPSRLRSASLAMPTPASSRRGRADRAGARTAPCSCTTTG